MKKIVAALAVIGCLGATPVFAAPEKASACPGVAAITSKMQPPEILAVMAKCIDSEQYEEATLVYAIAKVYIHFDAERLDDPDAALWASKYYTDALALSDQKKNSEFRHLLYDRAKGVDWSQKICPQARVIGMPSYDVPTYMFHDDKVIKQVPITAPKATWENILQRHLKCT